MKKLMVAIIMLAIVLSACASSQPAIQTAVASTITAWPTQTAYPTYTPFPTQTPMPTQPPFEVITVDQVAAAFQAAGLEIVDPKPATKDDYGLAPKVATTAGIDFLIPSLCSDCGGRISSFANEEDLQRLKAYYDDLGIVSDMFFSWTFTNKNILVQINGDLPEEIARQYEAVLKKLN